MAPKCFTSLWFIVLGTLEKMFQKPHFKLRKDNSSKPTKRLRWQVTKGKVVISDFCVSHTQFIQRV